MDRIFMSDTSNYYTKFSYIFNIFLVEKLLVYILH